MKGPPRAHCVSDGRDRVSLLLRCCATLAWLVHNAALSDSAAEEEDMAFVTPETRQKNRVVAVCGTLQGETVAALSARYRMDGHPAPRAVCISMHLIVPSHESITAVAVSYVRIVATRWAHISNDASHSTPPLHDFVTCSGCPHQSRLRHYSASRLKIDTSLTAGLTSNDLAAC